MVWKSYFLLKVLSRNARTKFSVNKMYRHISFGEIAPQIGLLATKTLLKSYNKQGTGAGFVEWLLPNADFSIFRQIQSYSQHTAYCFNKSANQAYWKH